jgi:MFS family permease
LPAVSHTADPPEPVVTHGQAVRPTLRSVLATDYVAPTLVLSLVARLPLGAIALLLLLRVADAHDYTSAGIVDAVFAMGYGISQPLSSRLVDRFGQTRVIVPMSIACAAALAIIGAAPDATSVVGFAGLALLTALLYPPLGGSMRALWDFMLPTDEERHVGYSIDAGTAEIIWTVGPLVLVGVFAATYGADVGLLLCACILVAGGLGFAACQPSRRWRPSETEHARGVLGPLRSPGIRTLVLVAAVAGAHFNSMQLAVTAFGRTQGSTGSVGVLLGLWAAGSLIAGLLLTRVPPPRSAARRLALVMGAMGALGATLGLAQSTLVAGILLFIVGAGVAPYFVTLNVALGSVAPVGMLTESYGLTATAATVGAALFVPFAGAITDHGGAAWSLTVAGGLPALAVVVLALRRGTLAATDDEPPSDETSGGLSPADVAPLA